LEVRDGKTVKKRQLSARFQELIDMIAMRRNLRDSDAYLEQWRKEIGEEVDGEIDAILNDAVAKLEECYDDIRSSAIEDLKIV
jgi:hypothetical protein